MNNLLSIVVFNDGLCQDKSKLECFEALDNSVGNQSVEILIANNDNLDEVISNSKSDKIAILNYDCMPHEAWIQSIISVYSLYRDIGVFGGPVFLVYPDFKPRWITGYFERLLDGLDYGPNNSELLHIPTWLPTFSNVSFKKWIWEDIGGFKNLSKTFFIQTATKYSHPKKLYIANMITHRLIKNNKLNIQWFEQQAYLKGYEFAFDLRNNEENKDKTIEDVIHDNVCYDWVSWLTHTHFYDIRCYLIHEESARIYIKNLLRCRIKYFEGLYNCLDKFQMKSYEELIGINPLFTQSYNR